MAREQSKGARVGGHHTVYMVVGIVLAMVVSVLVPRIPDDPRSTLPLFEAVGVGGEVFLRVLSMLVVPLVMLSVMGGILGLGDVRKLGRPGAAAVTYYLTTTLLAVITGLILVNVIRPGVGFAAPEPASEQRVAGAARPGIPTFGGDMGDGAADPSRDAPDDWIEVEIQGRPHFVPVYAEQRDPSPGIGTVLSGLVLMLFTDNLLSAMVHGQLLPLILFSIAFAGMLTTMGRRARTIADLVLALDEALLSFVLLVMRVAPLGVFCLVAARFGQATAQGEFWQQMKQLSLYVTTVLAGLGVHALLTLPLLLFLFSRRNPLRFVRSMFDALLTAFSTASSSATLPLTMRCAEENAGVSRRSVEFVLPLGATINMDGTALYEAAAAIFMAQIYAGVNPEFTLGLTETLVIAVTATLAAIGAAGIPEAGLVTMLIVLNTVGLPLTYLPLILPVDWFLDRFRTTVNVFGDAVGSAVVERTFPAEG